jgi:hypothetical protein
MNLNQLGGFWCLYCINGSSEKRMKGNVLVSVVLFTGLLVFSSCYYDVEETLYPGFCNTQQVTYEGVIKPLVELRCNAPACHVPGGDGEGDFSTYAGLKAKVDDGSVEEQVIVLGEMPPSGGLSSCEMDQLQIWINDGAPED